EPRTIRSAAVDNRATPVAESEQTQTRAATASALESSPAPEITSTVASMTWDALESAVRECVKCPLHRSRTQTVFGVGSESADWMFIGEAPGVEEDRQGEPFVGRAGQLLNAMLFAIGLKREDVYIANVLKCRPPKNRDPQIEEVECCEPYLLRQIELINPRIVLALGRHAAHSLLKTELPLSKLRGRRLSYHTIPLVVTYHPAYLLRNPVDKRKAWDDLCLARSVAGTP
ncbi:MAG: uracil-DNA glycosylase, partial [Burkholderiales bacterium]|nr:uracil-DNA glycosylase [Burkholderiales bacterium]